MKDDDDDDVEAIGGRIGRRLADAKMCVTQPSVAIRVFVDAILAEHSTVKLPELVRDEEVRHWLTARQLTDGQLRHALTEARRMLRSKRAEPAVKRPPRRRSAVADIPAPEVRTAGQLAAGAVPNRSLADI